MNKQYLLPDYVRHLMVSSQEGVVLESSESFWNCNNVNTQRGQIITSVEGNDIVATRVDSISAKIAILYGWPEGYDPKMSQLYQDLYPEDWEFVELRRAYQNDINQDNLFAWYVMGKAIYSWIINRRVGDPFSRLTQSGLPLGTYKFRLMNLNYKVTYKGTDYDPQSQQFRKWKQINCEIPHNWMCVPYKIVDVHVDKSKRTSTNSVESGKKGKKSKIKRENSNVSLNV